MLRAGESPHTATVSRFENPPTIDGVITKGEWKGATQTQGFLTIAGIAGDRDARLHPRLGETLVGFSAERLYIAVISELPPDGRPPAGKTYRDSELIWDDGIEIWIDPARDYRGSGEGDLGYFQFLGNAIGTIKDVRFDPSGSPDVGWNADWNFKNRIDTENNVWIAELSVPFKDLGWEDSPTGRSIGLLIARNFKRPWKQVTWMPHERAFVNFFNYPRVRLSANRPSVRITDLGEEVFKGRIHLRGQVYNPGPEAINAEIQLNIDSSDMPSLKDDKVVDVPAGGTAPYAFHVRGERLHENATHTLDLRVAEAGADDKPAIFDYKMIWTAAPEKRWAVRTGPNPEAAAKFAYYPSYDFVRVRLDPRELGKGFDETTSATVTITGPDGKEVVSRELDWETSPHTEQMEIDELADGEYTIAFAIPGYEGTLTRTFKHKSFAWQGNRLGITDKVHAPFTPIEVRGDTLSVVLRDYKIDGLGFWQSVQAVEEDILAGPMALKTADGQIVKGKGKFTTVSSAGHMAVYEGAAIASGARIATRNTTDYDGTMKVELTLAPNQAGEALDKLWVEIPIRDSIAPLYHVSTTALRTNPAGYTPKGEGVVWTSKDYPDGEWYGNFLPYVWVGGEEKGLCWFADNDRNWVLDGDPAKGDFAPSIELIRDRAADTLTMRINLVQKAVELTEPRTIVFGVLATPAKPMPENWRRIGINDPFHFTMNYMSDATFSAKAPRGEDFRIVDAMEQARRTGSIPQDLVNAWRKDHVVPLPEKAQAAYGAVQASRNVSRSARPGHWMSLYFDEFHATSASHPESKVFQSEWSGEWHRNLSWPMHRSNYTGVSVRGIVDSHVDFAVWYAAQYIKRGIGIYFDNSFPKRAYDLVTTEAYRLPNGSVQPSAGMWHHREYLKRIWVLHQELGPEDIKPLMMIHMTNTHIVPYMVFNEANLDLEWLYVPKPAQAKFSLDLLRAQSIGRQSGNVPFALARTDGAGRTHQHLRQRFGGLMVHDIRAFTQKYPRALTDLLIDLGYGKDGTTYWNYWQDEYPLQASDDRAKALVMKHGDAVGILIATWNGKSSKVTFTIDSEALGLQPTSAVDPESGDALPLNGQAFEIDLKPLGVRLVKLQ
jgi:hypothetical protein